MAGQSPLKLDYLFADGGELLRTAALQEPAVEVMTYAADSPNVLVREDSYDAKEFRDGTFEITGVSVDGTQLWQFPDVIEHASANITSIYSQRPGPIAPLRPLFDRQLAIEYGLRSDKTNRGIRTRIKLDPDGKLISSEIDVVNVQVIQTTRREFGEIVATTKNGDVIRRAAASALKHFGFGQEELLYTDEGKDPDQEYLRIAQLTTSAFANLINASLAQDSGNNRRPWIYKATLPAKQANLPKPTPKQAFYTSEPLEHSYFGGLYCKISPAFRELVALATQSLARFDMAGGSPDDVDMVVLDGLISLINAGYSNVDADRIMLEEQKMKEAA